MAEFVIYELSSIECLIADYSSLASIIIPNSATSIGNYAFCDRDSLGHVDIPDSVTSIGDDIYGDYLPF